MRFVDTHCHLDGEEFRDDLEAVVARAREAGVGAIGIPGIDLASCDTVMEMCSRYPDYCYPMLGLHPEEVKADWQTVLAQIKPRCLRGTGKVVCGISASSDDPLQESTARVGGHPETLSE